MKMTIWVVCLSVCLMSGSVFAGGKVAHIFIGDMNQPAYKTFLSSFFHMQTDPYEAAKILIDRKKQELEKLGYTVVVHDIAIVSDYKKALMDPNTGAVAWFGHGDPQSPGSTTCFQLNSKGEPIVIGTQDMKSWAQERWLRDQGWSGKYNQDSFDEWADGRKPPLSDEERGKLLLEFTEAHFNLDYAYFHSCHSFDNSNLPKVLMNPRQESQCFGYRGVKRSYDTEDNLYSAKWNPQTGI